jgi:hypothetical protein
MLQYLYSQTEIMKTFLRLFVNFVATGVVILIFSHIGWITFENPPVIISDPALNNILIAGIIGFIMFIIGELAGIGYGALVIMSCGVACLLFPIFSLLSGLIKLYGTRLILPEWFTFEAVWWKALVISIAVGMFRIPSVKEQKKIIVKERHSN